MDTATNVSQSESKNPIAAGRAENIRLVAAMQMFGGGPEEAEVVIGMLDMPGSKKFRDKTFRDVEEELGKVERQVTKEALNEALAEEIALTREELGSAADDLDSIPLIGSFDGGWQQKGSGRRYNSCSGHAAIIGFHTGKPIALGIWSKRCKKCECSEKKGVPAPTHECPKNHDGSSKAMESEEAVDALVSVFDRSEGKAHMGVIVIDDDATTENQCQWTGLLPARVPPPKFVVDPGHRIRTIFKPVFALANASKKVSRVEKSDAMRLKKYWGYRVQTESSLTL